MVLHKSDEEATNQPEQYANLDLNEKHGDGFAPRSGSVAYAKLQNPLAGMSYEELMDDVERFAREKNLMHAIEDFQKGALIAQRRSRFETIEVLTEEDKDLIRREKTNRWKQPVMMYYMTSEFLESFSAATKVCRADGWKKSSIMRWFGHRAGHGSISRQWSSSLLFPLLRHRRRRSVASRSDQWGSIFMLGFDRVLDVSHFLPRFSASVLSTESHTSRKNPC